MHFVLQLYFDCLSDFDGFFSIYRGLIGPKIIWNTFSQLAFFLYVLKSMNSLLHHENIDIVIVLQDPQKYLSMTIGKIHQTDIYQ